MSPDGSPVFGAALLSQCFLPVRPWLGQNGENLRQVATIGLETRKRRTDRRYDIFFITPFVPNTANEYQLLYRPRDYFARVSEKRRWWRGEGSFFVSSFSPFSFLFSLVQIILLGRKSRKHFIRTYNPVDRRKLKV